MAEKFFKADDDPEQMPINKKSGDKLLKLHPKSINFVLSNGHPVSWAVVVPTSKELAEKFINKEINERQLLDMSEPQKIYSALYLCSAFTIPEYRRKGLSLKLIKEIIAVIPHTTDCVYFYWPFSGEGRKLAGKLSEDLGIKILERN